MQIPPTLSFWRRGRCGRQDTHRNARCQLRRPVHPLGSLLKVGGPRLINFHEFLRVAVHQREPRALHLHHDAVATAEAVKNPRKLVFHFVRLAGLKRHRILKTLSEFPAKGLSTNKLLVAAHAHTLRVRVRVRIIPRINIDELDDPVGVRAGGGDVQ